MRPARVTSSGPDERSSTLIANADHALLTGDPAKAVALLTKAAD
ncbi:MAG TPA: hypothetical protein VG371_07880 [Solirubrobacteraceae bacterium]|nr:hypothetical protein [Solirubrobacteraceae bacterium]